MSEIPRTINLVPSFLDGLAAIQAYHGQNEALRGRQLTSAIVDFACDVVGAFPQAYPSFPVPKHPEREYRRAIFRRQHALIYRVTTTEIPFLMIYGTRQLPPDLSLDF